MAFIVVPGAWSEEGWKSLALNKAGAGRAISKVRATDCAGSSGTVCSEGGWRVDKQNPTVTDYNIQIQRNDVRGEKSSVGGVTFAKTLIGQIGSITDLDEAKKIQAIARSKELTSAIQSGLTQSVGTWAIGGPPSKQNGRFRFYKIGGTFSS